MNAPPTASQVLARISMDPSFKGFASTDFEPAAFASLVVDADSRSPAPPAGRVSRAESTMAEVGVYVSAVEGAIQAHIGENRETLLGGVGGIQDLQVLTLAPEKIYPLRTSPLLLNVWPLGGVWPCACVCESRRLKWRRCRAKWPK